MEKERGGVEGWGENADNCNWITIKNFKKRKKKWVVRAFSQGCISSKLCSRYLIPGSLAPEPNLQTPASTAYLANSSPHAHWKVISNMPQEIPYFEECSWLVERQFYAVSTIFSDVRACTQDTHKQHMHTQAHVCTNAHTLWLMAEI